MINKEIPAGYFVFFKKKLTCETGLSKYVPIINLDKVLTGNLNVLKLNAYFCIPLEIF